MKKLKKANRNLVDNSRKTIRKLKRKEKKLHRQEHYLKKNFMKEKLEFEPGKFVKRPPDSQDPDIEVKNKKQKKQPTSQELIKRDQLKEKKEADKLKSQMEEQRKMILLKANDEEDKMIRKLEKQLGLNKSKNKNNYFADDGLDYLLEICDKATTEQIVAAERHLANVDNESDFEEDLAAVTGKELHKDSNKKNDKKKRVPDEGNESEEMDEDEFGEEEFEDMSDDESDNDEDGTAESNDHIEEVQNKKESIKEDRSKPVKQITKPSKMRVVSESDISKVFNDDEVSHLSDDSDIGDNISGDENAHDDGKKDDKPDVWEDIYGRKRDKDGNVIKEEKGIYIPPHLRNKDSDSEKDLIQLKRQIKSVLNKLTGTNMHWACTNIESLYASHSRHSVSTCLWNVWSEACVGGTSVPPRLAAEHAALVAVLHANIATEVGAHFLQELSKKFDEMMQTPQPMEDKRLDNLVACLSHLYNFKIYHAALLYDILNRLLEKITEKNIDCILVALRTVGGVLRKEEPLALKNFIHHTQTVVSVISGEAAEGSRIKFLLDVLLAVKNNNLTKIPNYDPSYTEHLKKQIKGVIRKGNYITPLNISLEDLIKADERGKWWIVGSAWEGNRVVQPIEKVKPLPSMDQKLLELARKQRMNTDVRRSIFCVIMSAEDYMDAFEKLQHLGLKGQQEREIVHVLLACCLQEKSYNPYYAVLGQKLCDFDRKYQLSIQFSVWDKIKDIENLSKQSVSNLAQFLIHLIIEKGLPLSVLKVIEFSDLNKTLVKFMRQILLAIIMNADLQASLEVFHRVSKSQKLHMFRESVRLFIQHFLIKNAGKKNNVLSDSEMATLKERTMEVDKILTAHESKLRL